jgi:hypothetical protein
MSVRIVDISLIRKQLIEAKARIDLELSKLKDNKYLGIEEEMEKDVSKLVKGKCLECKKGKIIKLSTANDLYFCGKCRNVWEVKMEFEQ